MKELAFRAMGCQMLAVIDRDEQRAADLLADVPGWFEGWEQQLSRFRDDSALMRLNAAGQPFAAPPALWSVIGVALRAARQSDGLVSPTTHDALAAAGYDRTFAEIDRDRDRAPEIAQPPDWRLIARNERARTVTLPAGTHIDLGGVAKGWAADQAARRLAACGPALVDAGGDISVSGPMAGGAPWPIAVASPFAPEETLGMLLIRRGAVATSGRDYRRWRRGGVEQHHIIDPRTGRPADTDVLAATVVGLDGPSAEMAAKVALILGGRAGIAWLDAHAPLAGMLALEDGRVLHSRTMNRYLDRTSIHATAAC